MLVACLVGFLVLSNRQCHSLNPSNQDDHPTLSQCVINILNRHFSGSFELTYVNIQTNDDDLLKEIHSTINFTLISRESTHQMFVPNIGYLIYCANVVDFLKYFHYLIQERVWNPNVRFLIVIKSLKAPELPLIFNELLKQHVNNALIVNGTEDAELYTYNPFENYACGKYYNRIIHYGQCAQASNNLYPNKLVTGLRNCNFTASIAHRPPFTIDPLKTEYEKKLLGTEEYIITLLGEKEHFTVIFNYSYNGDLYSMVAPNMTAIGPMEMLQKNECDIMFGGLIVVTSRVDAFTYLHGYYDYSDELLFVVKRASYVPTWKYVFIEFQPEVWTLLLIAFIITTLILIILLDSRDKGQVLLRLLDSLLLHGRNVRTRLSVKCILVTWGICTYLINIFYQSSLLSITTHPSKEYQVTDEQDIVNHDFTPCFSQIVREFIVSERDSQGKEFYFRNEGCETTSESLNTVSITKNMFALISNVYYLYNEAKYLDKWGEPLVYRFQEPYTKFLFGFYFRKGFPITQSLQLNALRIKETGLADKNVNDHYYKQRLKKQFSKKTFEAHVLIPWFVFFPGLLIATVAFIIEILIERLKWVKCITFTFKNVYYSRKSRH